MRPLSCRISGREWGGARGGGDTAGDGRGRRASAFKFEAAASPAQASEAALETSADEARGLVNGCMLCFVGARHCVQIRSRFLERHRGIFSVVSGFQLATVSSLPQT